MSLRIFFFLKTAFILNVVLSKVYTNQIALGLYRSSSLLTLLLLPFFPSLPSYSFLSFKPLSHMEWDPESQVLWLASAILFVFFFVAFGNIRGFFVWKRTMLMSPLDLTRRDPPGSKPLYVTINQKSNAN